MTEPRATDDPTLSPTSATQVPSTSSTTTGHTTGPESADPLARSRTSAAWTAAVLLAVFLVLLIIFVAQNTQTAHVNFFGWDGNAPQAVMLLIATVTGMAVVALAGALRILQLRRRIKRTR